MNLYLVGGAVREHFLGHTTKDYDFAVEAESYDDMRTFLLGRGLRVWQERPEFVTLRGQLERSWLGDFNGLIQIASNARINADFTLCRAEAMYSDMRHPDTVTPADIYTDLSRRDFTMNAIAIAEEGGTIDPYSGREDITNFIVRAVGDPMHRMREDPLRMLRAIRFATQHGMSFDSNLRSTLEDPQLCPALASLPSSRVRDEMNKALRADVWRTLMFLTHWFPTIGRTIFQEYPDLWLKMTEEER